jgi:hypothetical protein
VPVGEVVIDQEQEDQVDAGVADGKRLGGGLDPPGPPRGRTCDRGCEHPLGPIDAEHGRVEDASQHGGEAPDAASQVDDAPDLGARELFPEDGGPETDLLGRQRSSGGIGLVNVALVVVEGARSRAHDFRVR